MRVYDLTVADEHVFYANGILTFNCADAHQYACLHFNPFTAQLQRRTPRRDVKKAAYVYAHA